MILHVGCCSRKLLNSGFGRGPSVVPGSCHEPSSRTLASMTYEVWPDKCTKDSNHVGTYIVLMPTVRQLNSPIEVSGILNLLLMPGCCNDQHWWIISEQHALLFNMAELINKMKLGEMQLELFPAVQWACSHSPEMSPCAPSCSTGSRIQSHRSQSPLTT